MHRPLINVPAIASVAARTTHRPWVTLALGLILVSGCSEQSGTSDTGSTADSSADSAPQSVEERLREQLASAKPGDVIDIPAGTHSIRRSLVMNASGVTIRGAGAGRSERDTVLSFKEQVAGAEGLMLTGSDLTVEHLAIEETQAKIEAAGGTIIRPTIGFPGGRRFHFADPNGNEYAVWSGFDEHGNQIELE